MRKTLKTTAAAPADAAADVVALFPGQEERQVRKGRGHNKGYTLQRKPDKEKGPNVSCIVRVKNKKPAWKMFKGGTLAENERDAIAWGIATYDAIVNPTAPRVLSDTLKRFTLRQV